MSNIDIIRAMIGREDRQRSGKAYKQAAVLVGIIQTANGDRIVFNRRAPHMNNHGGEICLPGGLLESIDRKSHINAALRETHEEIGLPPENVQVFGMLESCITSRRLEVTPVVGLVSLPPDWTLQPDEVAEVVELPLDVFLEARNYQKVARHYHGRKVNSVAITCNHYEIWGLTAKIMMQLQQTLEEHSTI